MFFYVELSEFFVYFGYILMILVCFPIIIFNCLCTEWDLLAKGQYSYPWPRLLFLEFKGRNINYFTFTLNSVLWKGLLPEFVFHRYFLCSLVRRGKRPPVISFFFPNPFCPLILGYTVWHLVWWVWQEWLFLLIG